MAPTLTGNRAFGTRPVKLRDIKIALLKGQHPEDMGARKCGEGCYKIAYRLGEFIIKEIPEWEPYGSKVPYRFLRKVRVCRPQQWVFNRYLVQMAYKTVPLHSNELNDKMDQYFEPTQGYRWNKDLHNGNVGWNHLGLVVAFDW